MPLNLKVSFILIGLLWAPGVWGKTYRACSDSAGWPPYSYQDPKDPKKAIGSTVEFLKDIAAKEGLDLKVELLEWESCTLKVKKGDYFQIMLDASDNERRSRDYLKTQPLYELEQRFFYSKARYPMGPGISKQVDAKKFRICGIKGYNFGVYDFKSSLVDQGVTTAKALFNKLRKNRCDLAIAYSPIMKNLEKIGLVSLKGTDSVVIPKSNTLEYHLMFNKNEKKLRDTIDKAITKARSDGTYSKYFGSP
jgi:polar amino acid transport system substrate-binding protein